MAKKLSLKDIAISFEKLCDAYNINNLLITNSVKSSQSRFDYHTKTVIEFFGPLIILNAYFFYRLKNKECLNKQKIKSLNKIINERFATFSKEINGDSECLEYAAKLLKKTCIAEPISRHDYEKRDCIQFDDDSNDEYHLQAFNCCRTKQNILLKINSSGSESTHIRIGINVANANHKEALLTLCNAISKT